MPIVCIHDIGFTSQACREVCREGAQVSQLLAQFYVWSIQQHGQKGLRSAGIGDDLLGKEDFAMVFLLLLHWTVVSFSLPFEEEDQPIDWPAS